MKLTPETNKNMAKKNKDPETKSGSKKTLRTSDIITVYNALRSAKITRLDKTGQFTVIRAVRALKPVATAFEDFLKDAQERLRPEGYDKMMERYRIIESLPPVEQIEAAAPVEAYQKTISECIQPELDKMREVDTFKGFSEDVLSKLASENEISVNTIMLIEDVCGREE